jgi:hypothetical protein
VGTDPEHALTAGHVLAGQGQASEGPAHAPGMDEDTVLRGVVNEGLALSMIAVLYAGMLVFIS